MKRAFVFVIVLTFTAFSIYAQRTKPADPAELEGITQRGKALAEYDVAAWHSTDAVMALSPKEGSIKGYVARKTGNTWIVVYGHLSEKKDKYLITYQATQQVSPVEFKVQAFDKPREDTEYFLFAARAIETARATFSPAEMRPYNAAVLPGNAGRFIVYFVPAQTQNGIFPLGGDVRYTISNDGTKILESRQLHKSIIEFQVPQDMKPETGYHTAILDEIPEDTDVFHVLAREPRIPELVVTQKFVYRIAIDGSIQFLMTTEAFKKVGNQK
jgi:hypothetical protein